MDSPRPPLLDVQDLHKSFGGIRAVNGTTLAVREQSIIGLIGPNGAGKTTLFNLIAGVYRPEAGRIIFDSQEIQGLLPYEIVGLGAVKTFQIPREFRNVTVLENLMLAAKGNAGERFSQVFLNGRKVRKQERETRERARGLLAFFELDRLEMELARNLSGGQKKLLELARALMTDPRLIMLDEPVAGVNRTLAAKILDQVEELRQGGLTFFIIEHDMDVVMNRVDSVIVMHEGRVLAEGTPNEIKANEEVIETYLGM
ncbi:MAG: ABC transporter ATP-binding protein [candidate division NC10 bacterium]